MAYVAQNREDIEGKLKEYFELAGLGNLVAGTPEHALWQILTDNLFQLYADINSAYSDKLPLNATGGTLDLWTNFFNIKRKMASYALDESATNVHFFISEANRSLVNEGSAIEIPAGVEVSVRGIRKFTTLTPAEIPALGSPPYVAYVGVQATESGTYNNIGEGELDRHNLDDILPGLAGVSAIEISNKFPITSGTFPQLDTDLQNELQNVFGKSIGSNLEGLLSSVRQMPGVAGVEILEAKRGTGTFSMFVDSTSPIISMSLIGQIQEFINGAKPIGTMGYVEYPRYKAVKAEFEIVPKEGVTVEEAFANLGSETTPNIIAWVNNLERGSTMNIQTVLGVVVDNDMVQTAVLKELRIGEFSVIQDKIINSEIVGAGTKEAEWDEKWFTSSDLISYCSNGLDS
tara:strand:+ start:1890 stop:3098 length:1209 start_codon:yes stop_codon:yes gene_type:complete